MDYSETFRAPPDATEAEVRFRLIRDSRIARTDANLKVDDASFGPAAPSGGTLLVP